MHRFLIACVFAFGIGASSHGQEVIISGQAGFNADSPYNRLYNTSTVITIKGRVVGQTIAAPLPGMANGITLLVKTAQGKTWNVDVGPEWYVNNQKTVIKVKDNVQVTGSRVTINGHDVILAEMIVKNKNVLTLRRPMGRPYWDAVIADRPEVGTGIQTITGTITTIDTFVDGTNGTTQRLTIHTDNGDIQVALAPEWFMQRQAAQLALGSYVNVNAFAPTGVPTQPAGAGLLAPPIIFATSVNFGNQWMVLRSVNGRPMWFGPGG